MTTSFAAGILYKLLFYFIIIILKILSWPSWILTCAKCLFNAQYLSDFFTETKFPSFNSTFSFYNLRLRAYPFILLTIFSKDSLSPPACLMIRVLATRQEVSAPNPNLRMDVCSELDSTLNGDSGLFSPQ